MPDGLTRRDLALTNLPPRIFLYTLDQICAICTVKQATLEQTMVYFEGRSLGEKKKTMLRAHNIMPSEATPEWRVADTELVRWMKYMGFRFMERGYVID